MRQFIVTLLLILGGIFSVVASIGVWADRTVYDEDGFVSSVDAVFNEEDVQIVLARGLSDATYELIGGDELVNNVLVGVDDLLAEAIEAVAERTENIDILDDIIDPEIGENVGEESTRDGLSLTLLAGPLSETLRDLLFEAALAVLRAQPFREIRDGALRIVHRQVIAIIEESDEAGLRREGDRVVLNLGGAIERVVIAVAGEEGEQFLARSPIPDDAGEFVVRDEGEYSWIWNLARAVQNFIPVLVGITAGVLALAVAISANRRGTITWVGLTVALSATLFIIALPAAREVAVNWVLDPENNAAARAVFDAVLLRQLELQSVIIIVGGVAVAGGAALTGESELAVALRASVRPGRDGGQAVSLREALRRRAGVLRLWGLGIAAVLLVAWPDPTTRVYVTMLGFLVAYLLLITVATSDAEWAAGTRVRVGAFWDRYLRVQAAPAGMANGSVQGWIAVRAGWFRGLGIVAAGAALLFWPSLSFGAVIGVIAATLIYLAVLEGITNR